MTKHVVVVFRKTESVSKMHAVIDLIFKRLPSRICYQKHSKIDPDEREAIAKKIRFCFGYPEATFYFSDAQSAVIAEEFIEDHCHENREARRAIERVTIV